MYPKRYSYILKGQKHSNIKLQSLGSGSETLSISVEENEGYIEECQAIANPFTNRSYPSRPKPSPFAKGPTARPKM